MDARTDAPRLADPPQLHRYPPLSLYHPLPTLYQLTLCNPHAPTAVPCSVELLPNTPLFLPDRMCYVNVNVSHDSPPFSDPETRSEGGLNFVYNYSSRATFLACSNRACVCV